MVKQSILLQKFQNVDKCLQRIDYAVKGNAENIYEIDVQDIFVLNLQRATQLVIDVAAHIIKDDKIELPVITKDYFSVISNQGIISKELSVKLGKMVGFRNIAVHDYQALNLDILKSIYRNNIRDLLEFRKEVLEFYENKLVLP